MNKSGIVIASALLTLGLAAGAMAADMPKSVSTMAADAPAASGADTAKPAKKHKKHKKAAAAPSTTK
ncbi:MAG: hypothetical protein QOD56_504 [Gammaproteobacteria bacterium]|jgi:hypothetical protein|nr:hypothetical protein [Gammaproteobacteria bacterium]